jgi:Ta0938
VKVNYEGCAICDSTWGDVWEEVEGERLFFCCDICVVQFRGLVGRIKQETGWRAIDSLEISGDRRGRSCRAVSGGLEARFGFAFNPQGRLRRFERLPSAPTPA